MPKNWITVILAGANLACFPPHSTAQTAPPQPVPVVFVSIPGGTVEGKFRGTVKPTMPLPTVKIIAPDGYSGLTASPSPNLYFYVSERVTKETRFTIRAPGQPTPIIETCIQQPQAAGIYAIHLADHRVRLEPGIIYTWSISIIFDHAPSRDIVASATLVRVPLDFNLDTAVRAVPAQHRAELFASANLWYDAVAIAEDLNQHAVLDAMINRVGLLEPATYDLQTTALATQSCLFSQRDSRN